MKVRKGYHSYQLEQNLEDRTPVSQIPLKGKWLVDAGFKAEQPIEVQVKKGKIIITLDE